MLGAALVLIVWKFGLREKRMWFGSAPRRRGRSGYWGRVLLPLIAATLDYDLLLYDVTSTYFEGQVEDNPQAQRGYSRDHRPDCN